MVIPSANHNIVIDGGGSSGISVASRLQHKGFKDIGLIDPAQMHYYQPLWTLVGGGRAPAAESGRPEADLIPSKVSSIQEPASHIDPSNQHITLGSDKTVTYDHLVVCPGIQLDFGKIPGMSEALDNAVGSYQLHLRTRTQDVVPDPGDAFRNRGVHHARWSHQVCRSTPQDRLPCGRLLATARHPEQDPCGVLELYAEGTA